MATNYQLKQGETPAQYKERVGLNKPTGSAPPPAGSPTSDQNSAIFNALQARLTEQAGAISSASTKIEDKIASAMSGVRAGADSENKRIESQFGREIGYAYNRVGQEVQNFSESRSGGATQMAAFRNLVDTTDKYLADLAQRKEELILQNNAAAAGKIADLELKSLEYIQKAQQDTFDNIFKSAGLELSSMAERRAGLEFKETNDLARMRLQFDRQDADDRKQATMASLATQYGVTIEDGDDLADIVRKVAPMASAKQKLEIKAMEAQIANSYKDIEDEEVMVGYQDDIWAAMHDNNLTATEAVDFAMAKLNANNIKPTRKEFNAMNKYAQELKRGIERDKAKNEAQAMPGVASKMFDFFKKMSPDSYAIPGSKPVDLFGNTF